MLAIKMMVHNFADGHYFSYILVSIVMSYKNKTSTAFWNDSRQKKKASLKEICESTFKMAAHSLTNIANLMALTLSFFGIFIQKHKRYEVC